MITYDKRKEKMDKIRTENIALRAEINELMKFVVMNLTNFEIIGEVEQAKKLMNSKQDRLIRNTKTIQKLYMA